ncbi:MAG: hypothetical protein AAF497_07555 [Planctomycetota bacterium]
MKDLRCKPLHAINLRCLQSQMSTRSLSTRVPDELVDRIKQQFPDFDKKRGANSGIVLELLERGLSAEPAQGRAEQLASEREELRDLQHEVRQLRKNLSVVLELVLLNLTDEPKRAENIIRLLREGGVLA